MTEAEARRAFEKLASIVRNAGLPWVVDQVVDYVSRGKQQEADVTVTYSLALEGGIPVAKPGRRQRQKMLRTVPYSDVERLAILADAVINAIEASASLDDSLTDFAKNENRGGVRFISDRSGEHREHAVKGVTKTRRDALARLRQALTAIKNS